MKWEKKNSDISCLSTKAKKGKGVAGQGTISRSMPSKGFAKKKKGAVFLGEELGRVEGVSNPNQEAK